MSKFAKTGVIIREDTDLTVGAFSASTAKLIGNLAMEEDFRMLKSELQVFIEGLTAGEADDIKLGIANGALTIAQIKAAIETNGPIDANDRANKETAERFVKIVGVLRLLPDQTSGVKGYFVGENNSPMIEVKPRWTFNNPEGWNWFLFNNGSTLTTGAAVRLQAVNYGLWVV